MSEKLEFISEDKELSGEATDNVEVPQEDPKQTEGETQATEETPQEESQAYKVGDREFSTVDKLIEFAGERDKSYQNAQQLIGRQGSELGELRQSVDKLSESLQSPQDETPEVQFDPYDAESVKSYLDQERKKIVADVMGQVDKKERERKQSEAMSIEVMDFIQNHPDLGDDDLNAIAKYGDERGVLRFEDAYRLKRYEEMEAKVKGIESQKEAAKKEEATKAPQTRAGVGGSNKGDIDFDNLTAKEWNNLSEDVRQKALMEATPGT